MHRNTHYVDGKSGSMHDIWDSIQLTILVQQIFLHLIWIQLWSKILTLDELERNSSSSSVEYGYLPEIKSMEGDQTGKAFYAEKPNLSCSG